MTEKNYNPQQKQRKAMKKAEVAIKVKKEIIKDNEGKKKVLDKSFKKIPETDEKQKEPEKSMVKVEGKISEKSESDTQVKDSKKSEPKEKKQTKPKVKKSEAVVNSYNLPISTKKSVAICKFIKGKTIDFSLDYLEEVIKEKKAIPMKGEIPHRKGKMMSGGFPKNSAKQFIILLRSLAGNSVVNEINNPIIVGAVANLASRPYAKFGRWRRKRTHVKLVARDKKSVSKPTQSLSRKKAKKEKK